MRRLRILFLVVAVVLLVPMCLLVRRAVQSVELERRTRHQAVAERIFDEMERSLSDLIAREEQRGFAEYGNAPAPPGEKGQALADAPGLPYIVGHFQIDPGGRLQAPLESEDKPDQPAAPAVSELKRAV